MIFFNLWRSIKLIFFFILFVLIYFIKISINFKVFYLFIPILLFISGVFLLISYLIRFRGYVFNYYYFYLILLLFSNNFFFIIFMNNNILDIFYLINNFVIILLMLMFLLIIFFISFVFVENKTLRFF